MRSCPLCEQKVEKFHKRSHLVPEWMYTDCYDQGHKVLEVSRQANAVTKKQKGVRGSFICPDCESTTQQYDHYASLTLTDRSPHSDEFKSIKRHYTNFSSGSGQAEYGRWEDVDFAKLQKFVISVVLRTHFAGKLDGELQLAEKHLNGLLTLYRAEPAEDDLTYPVVITEYSKTDDLRHHVILPFVNKKNGHHFIEFVGGGYIFNVYVSSHKKPQHVENLRLKADGSMYLVVMRVRETGLFRKSVELTRTVKRHFRAPA